MTSHKYLIFSRNDSGYTGELTEEFILYKNEKLYAPTIFMRDSGNYGCGGGDFLIKCVDNNNNVLFITSYKKLANYITESSGRLKIKQLYCTLERKRKGEDIKEICEPKDEFTLEKIRDLESSCDESIDICEISNSLNMTTELFYDYIKERNFSPDIHDITMIYEQLNAINNYIKNTYNE